jgi:hypothetical protein
MAFVDISGADSRKARVAGTAVPSALGACPAGATDMVIATPVDEDGTLNATPTCPSTSASSPRPLPPEGA